MKAALLLHALRAYVNMGLSVLLVMISQMPAERYKESRQREHQVIRKCN